MMPEAFRFRTSHNIMLDASMLPHVKDDRNADI